MTASDSDLPRPPAASGEGDLHDQTAAAARELFAARKLSPVELMAATIARIEEVDPLVNALPIRLFDQALQAARLAEERFAGRHGGPRPLEGIPVAVKDEVEVAGQP